MGVVTKPRKSSTRVPEPERKGHTVPPLSTARFKLTGRPCEGPTGPNAPAPERRGKVPWGPGTSPVRGLEQEIAVRSWETAKAGLC